MLVSKYTALNTIKIKEPKYSTRELLVACYKVRSSNKLIIERGAYQGEYFMHGTKLSQYPKTTNGRIDVYRVPLDDLEPLEYTQDVVKIARELFNE